MAAIRLRHLYPEPPEGPGRALDRPRPQAQEAWLQLALCTQRRPLPKADFRELGRASLGWFKGLSSRQPFWRCLGDAAAVQVAEWHGGHGEPRAL